ncbi:MAG: hypothetical protein IJH34_11325 [Romboutsia sp.]|nr:hypothetical protein [Romboutsia sp.]
MFLNNIYNSQKEELKDANIEIFKIAESFDLKITIGDNLNWCTSRNEEEQAIAIDKNLIKLLDLLNIKYSKSLKDNNISLKPDEFLTVEFEDESGEYYADLYPSILDVDGIGTLDYWIDFNSLKRKSLKN